MPFVAVPGAAEATIHFLLDGQDIENTLWFGSELGVVSSADVSALGGSLSGWITTNFMNNIPAAVVANFMSVRAMDVVNGPGQDFFLGSTPGAIADDPLPNEVTLAVSFRTGNTGRGSRGRNYIPALGRSNVTGNIVDGALMDNILTSYNGLNTEISGTGFVHIVAHRFSGFTIVAGKKVPTPLSVGVAQPVLSYIFADNVVDAQRRRGPGRGR